MDMAIATQVTSMGQTVFVNIELAQCVLTCFERAVQLSALFTTPIFVHVMLESGQPSL